MSNETLLGHIAERFTGQVENIATESLAYIINKAPTAKKALFKFLEQASLVLGESLSVQTQRPCEEESIPDIQVKNSAGKTVLIIESKFWAGLTDAQPIKYLKTLSKDCQTMLVFISPSRRLPTLWAEILRRCNLAECSYSATNHVNPEYWISKTKENAYLGILSWRALLSYILNSVEAEGNIDVAADVKQLIGLCEKQDKEAFLPLASEELSSYLGKRIVQFNRIVNIVTDQLVAANVGAVKGLKATAAENWYGRYIRISGYGCLIHFNASYWAKWRETPLWFNIKEIVGERWEVTTKLRNSLESLKRKDPPRLFFDNEDDDVPVIPLFLPFGTEEREAVDSISKQIMDVIGLLRKEKTG
jgi:hypothetical protein